MSTLIIIDCQYDFIEGTLKVKDADKAVDSIVELIKMTNIDKVIFTADWHPTNHCSFKDNGGMWPKHCINFTKGASIDCRLIEIVEQLKIPYHVSYKGTNPLMEAYGAFSQGFYCYGEVIICGIAGDYCVSETIKNLCKYDIKPAVYLKGIASIDNGETLNEVIQAYNLETV